MQETSSIVELSKSEGVSPTTTRPAYGHIYKGHFKDKNPDIRTVRHFQTIINFIFLSLKNLNYIQGWYFDIC
jgi:hypothetical protein